MSSTMSGQTLSIPVKSPVSPFGDSRILSAEVKDQNGYRFSNVLLWLIS